MRFFFSGQATRLTARVILGLWLMGVGLGIANACLAQEHHARHGHIQQSDTAISAAQLACQDFCAAGQSGVSKQLDDAQQPLIGSPTSLVGSWPARPSPYRQVLWSVRGDAGLHPPAFISFLRMTL